jgi:outer membrane protein assembly factor BamA
MRLAYDYAPPVGGFLSRQSTDLDARKYIRLATNGVLAFRFRGFKSWGQSPGYLYYGGNSEMRGYDYLQFLGHKAFFANAELRFPLIHAMATPIGILGGIRGVFFFNVGGAALENQSFKVWESKAEVFPAETTSTGIVTRPAQRIEGFRLRDSFASYGIGLETFALGFPVHFDWSYRTLFNKAWEDYKFAADGGSSAFRKARFTAWIGYDF